MRETIENYLDELMNNEFNASDFISHFQSKGFKVTETDSGYDDGIDDDDCEDNYIMYHSFDIDSDNESYWVTVCYGNNTMLVGDYRINEN